MIKIWSIIPTSLNESSEILLQMLYYSIGRDTTYCFVSMKFMVLVKQKSKGKLQNTKENQLLETTYNVLVALGAYLQATLYCMQQLIMKQNNIIVLVLAYVLESIRHSASTLGK